LGCQKAHERVPQLVQRPCTASNVPNDDIKKLAASPIFTVMTYQAYDINGYTFYTVQQDKKSIYQNSGVCIDA